MNNPTPQIVYSAVQPTGTLTLGNYLGAIKNWQNLLSQYNCYFSVADLHSITVNIVPAELRKNVLNLYAMFVACGISPDKCTLFVQSHVSAHSQLAWLLNCQTLYGEAARMTQFKDKSIKHSDNINLGLFTYPTLMAADILLYQTNFVPVGVDQKQHLELARDIAIRFNNKYSATFTVPEVLTAKFGAKVMSLADPNVKMGKTDANVNAYILLTDDADTISRKVARAVTDSDTKIMYDPVNKAGISNLLTIYCALNNTSIEKAQDEFSSKTYAQFKSAVADVVISTLDKIQTTYKQLVLNPDYLKQQMLSAANKASLVANKTLAKAYKRVGLI